jgi:hypothetical protein
MRRYVEVCVTKKVMICLLVVTMFFALVPNNQLKAASKSISFKINAVLFKAPAGEPAPYINKERRTMIPIRFFAAALGVLDDEEHVQWNLDTKTATIIKDDTKVEITLGQRYILVNGERVVMDTAAEMKNQRTFIPARFMAEALGAKVVWDLKNQTVHIISMNDESMFQQDREVLIHYLSADNFKAKNGKLFFRADRFENIQEDWQIIEEAYENYLPSEKLNPNINRQLYNLTLALTDESHFTETRYHPQHKNLDFDSKISVKYGLDIGWILNNNANFSFEFSEEVPIVSPSKYGAFMLFNIGSLYPPNRRTPGEPIEPYYENKVRSAFVALFGEKDGIDIHNYIIDEYLKNFTMETYESYRVTKTKNFGDICIDYSSVDKPFPVHFYFSYAKGKKS